MHITTKFKTGDVINFDGKAYEVTKRMAMMDVDLLDSGYYSDYKPFITYDLKPYWKLQGYPSLYAITESEIIENMRIIAYHNDLKNKKEMSEGK